jgi:hypothetical protein
MIRTTRSAAQAEAVKSTAGNDLSVFPRPSSRAPRPSRSEITKRTQLPRRLKSGAISCIMELEDPCNADLVQRAEEEWRS